MGIKKVSDKRKEYLQWYSEIDMFIEIRNERQHICDYCWKKIKKATVSSFAHIVPKSISKKHRLNKHNIMLVHDAICHMNIDTKFNWERYYLLRQLDNWYTLEDIKKEFLK